MKTTRFILALALLAHLPAAVAPAHAAPLPEPPAALLVQAQKTHVVDTATDSAGNPLRGKITFVLTQKSATSPDGLVVAIPTVSATLDSAGKFDVYLYPSASLSPVSYYQVYVTAGAGSQTLIGVYNIPASSSVVTLAPYKVTDAALAAQYTFASVPSVLALTNAVAGATFQSLLSGTTAGRVMKRGGSGLLDSAINETDSAVTVGKAVTVTGTLTATSLVGNAAGLTGLTGATGGVSNTGSTTVGADTDSDGVGVIDLQTKGQTRLRVGNAGGIEVFGGLTVGGQSAVVESQRAALESALAFKRGVLSHVRVEDTSNYDAIPVAFWHPTAGLQIYARRGTKHPSRDLGHIRKWAPVGEGALDQFTSAPLFDDTAGGIDSLNVAGGVTPAGTVMLFVTRYNVSTSSFVDIRVKRSTDGGATWADLGTLNTNGASDYGTYASMISVPWPNAAGFRLFVSLYDIATQRTWLAYSDDDGLTWATGANIKQGTNHPAECAIVFLSGSGTSAALLGVARDVDANLWQFKSTDGGATWTDMGRLPFSSGVDTDVSPALANLGDNRVTLVWADRATHQMKTVTAKIADVLSGVSGWGGASNVRVIYRSTMFDRGVSGGEGHFGYPAIFRLGGGSGKYGLGIVFNDMDRTSVNTLNNQVVDADLNLMPLFPEPGARLYSTANQTLAASADTVDFSAVVTDTGGYFTSPDRIDFREGGRHALVGNIAIQRPAPAARPARVKIAWVLNDQRDIGDSQVVSDADYFTAGVFGDLIYLTVRADWEFRPGDFAKLYIDYVTADGSSLMIVAAPYFSAHASVMRFGY